MSKKHSLKKVSPKLFFSLIGLIALGTTLNISFADLTFLNGGVKNQNSGPLNFDTDNDGTTDISMTQNGELGIGTTSPKSTLEILGSLGFIPESINASKTLSSNTLVLVDTSGANITLTMPTAASSTGRIYQIKKTVDANDLIITASTNIDKASSITLSTSSNGLPYANIFSNGTQWYLRSKSEE